MKVLIRFLLALEAVAFAAAALIHSGLLVAGHEHWKAETAESVIGAVLALGLAATFLWPRRARAVAFGAQGFALLGTLVGIFTIAVGVGPRSALDFAFHGGFLVALIAGLILVARGRGAQAPAAPEASHVAREAR